MRQETTSESRRPSPQPPLWQDDCSMRLRIHALSSLPLRLSAASSCLPMCDPVASRHVGENGLSRRLPSLHPAAAHQSVQRRSEEKVQGGHVWQGSSLSSLLSSISCIPFADAGLSGGKGPEMTTRVLSPAASHRYSSSLHYFILALCFGPSWHMSPEVTRTAQHQALHVSAQDFVQFYYDAHTLYNVLAQSNQCFAA